MPLVSLSRGMATPPGQSQPVLSCGRLYGLHVVMLTAKAALLTIFKHPTYDLHLIPSPLPSPSLVDLTIASPLCCSLVSVRSSKRELLQTEGTVVLHITTALKQDPNLRKVFTNSLKVRRQDCVCVWSEFGWLAG